MQCNCAGHKFTFRSSLGFSSFLHDYKVTVLTRTTSLTSYRSLLHKEQGVLSYQWNIFEEFFVQSWMLSPLVQTSKSINKKHKTEQTNVIYSNEILRSKKGNRVGGATKTKTRDLGSLLSYYENQNPGPYSI